MIISEHGGDCCGIHHLSGFPPLPSQGNLYYARLWDEDNEAINNYPVGPIEVFNIAVDYFTRTICRSARFRVLEVVLKDNQRINQGWGDILLAKGFKEVVRFRNGNSGNWLTIYHYHPNAEADYNKTLEEPAPVAATPPQPAPVLPAAPLAVGTRVRLREDYSGGGGRYHVGWRGTVQSVSRASILGPLATVQGDDGRLLRCFLRRLEVIPQVRQEPRHIFSTFHCVYRDDHRGAGYDTDAGK